MCKCGDACKCKQSVNAMKVPELLASSAGKFITVTFTKKDGSLRKLNGRFGVRKGVKGTGKALAAHKANPYLVMWDAQIREFRMVNLATIKEVCACHKTYKVE